MKVENGVASTYGLLGVAEMGVGGVLLTEGLSLASVLLIVGGAGNLLAAAALLAMIPPRQTVVDHVNSGGEDSV